MAQSFKIQSSIAGARAALSIGEHLVTATWKKTKNQESMERAIAIPMECVKAPEVSEAFRALVESALQSTAQDVLKSHVNAQPNNFELLADLLTRPQLVESFLARGQEWMTKEELEEAFKASATWKKYSSDAKYNKDAAFTRAANGMRDDLLKLTGKAVSFKPERCDWFLAKMAESDLDTEVGAFIVKRLASIKASAEKAALDYDPDALG